jgi:hypothetical protein
MEIKEFIEKAKAGGYDYNGEIPPFHDMLCQILLDPEAWKAVGKVGGFKDEKYCASGAGCEWDNQSNHEFACVWKYSPARPEYLFYGMGEALWKGDTIEQYLATLT